LNEVKLRQQLALGTRAQQALDVVSAVFHQLRTEAMEASCSHPGNRADDIAAREGHRRDVVALDRVKAKLEAIIADGRAAKRDIDQT
jgi:hypothetical protein